MYIEIVSTGDTKVTKLNEKISCPSCGGGSHVKKGKTPDGQLQKLKCKKCNRNFRVEINRYDKQMGIPTVETRIVKYPNGGYSVCKIMHTESTIPNKWIDCLLVITPKTRTYRETIKFIRNDKDIVLDNPKPIEINRYIPETMVNDLKKLFGRYSHSWVNVLNEMVK